MPFHEFIWEASGPRTALETDILRQIEEAELSLANALEHTLVTKQAAGALTDYSGWSIKDLGQLAIGGSGTAAAVTFAARATPGLLGMIGLGAASVVATPLAVIVGAAGVAWSATTAAGNKRDAYLKVVQDAITRLLTAQHDKETSVLSRHLRRLDDVFQMRCGSDS